MSQILILSFQNKCLVVKKMVKNRSQDLWVTCSLCIERNTHKRTQIFIKEDFIVVMFKVPKPNIHQNAAIVLCECNLEFIPNTIRWLRDRMTSPLFPVFSYIPKELTYRHVFIDFLAGSRHYPGTKSSSQFCVTELLGGKGMNETN